MRYDDILDEMERKAPGISRAMADSLSGQEEKDSLMSFVTPKGVPAGVIQATRQSAAPRPSKEEPAAVQEFISRSGRYPGSSEREVLESMPAPQSGEDSGVTYSNYRTGPGIKLPEGMAMMGEEPRKATEQEYLVQNGALDIVGHDPYRAAWDRTVKAWDGWFDIMGGEPTPENPQFRATFGSKFDEELKLNQMEEMTKRNKGMEKITGLLNNYRGAMDEAGNPIPDSTEADVLKTMGVKALPGLKDPKDYQNGIPDAGMNTFKEQKREEWRARNEALKEGKDQERAKAKWISDNTSKLNQAYSEMKTTVNEKIASWKGKLKEAEKHYKAGEEGWETYIQSYKDSIARLEDFREKFPDYLDADRTAISQGQRPVNWQDVKHYWSNAIIKYK